MKKKNLLLEILLTLLGTGVVAFGTHVFITPNQMASGGVAGLSIILNTVLKTPVGITNLVLNIPLLILGFYHLGRRFILKTVISVVAFTIFYDVVFLVVPSYQGETLLAALFGGVFVGAGGAIAYIGEGSTGGFDISNRVLHKKYPHISLGNIAMLSNTIVILLSALVFQSIEAGMYSLVAIIVSAYVVDKIIYGLDIGKMVMVISSNVDDIAAHLMKKQRRGLTKFDCTGIYTKEEKGMLLCAVRNHEYYRLKRWVQEVDPTAFLIVTTANEVVGKGFKAIDK